MATKKSEKKLATSPAAAARVAFVKSVHLVGLGLDNTHARVDRAAIAKVRSESGQFSAQLSIGHEVIEHDDEGFVVGAKFEFVQRPEGSETECLTITAEFSAKFNLTEKASKEAMEQFARLEARLIFFPYIRHFISDLSYRMSIDPILLPMSSEFENR